MERGFPTCKTISQAGLFNPIQESLRFDFTSSRLHFAPDDNLQTQARWCICGEGKEWNQWKISKKDKKAKKKWERTEREGRPDPVETDIGVLPPLIVLPPSFVLFLYFSFFSSAQKKCFYHWSCFHCWQLLLLQYFRLVETKSVINSIICISSFFTLRRIIDESLDAFLSGVWIININFNLML